MRLLERRELHNLTRVARSDARRVLLCIPGDPTDGSWSEAAARAAAVAESNRLRVSVVQTLEPAINDTWDAVIGHSTEYADLFAIAASEFPEIQFVVSDDVGPPSRRSISPNISYIDWRWDEATFLAGVLASRSSSSKTIAFLGGAPVLTQQRTLAGFAAGASQADPRIRVLGAFCGTFRDVEIGRRLGHALLKEGADVLLHTADRCGTGAIEAADAEGAKAIGFMNDDDLSHTAVIGFIASDVRRAMSRVLDLLAGNSQLPKVLAFGLDTGLLSLQLAAHVPDRIGAEVARSEAALRRGDVIFR